MNTKSKVALLFSVISFWTFPGLSYLFVGRYFLGLGFLGTHIGIGIIAIFLVMASVGNVEGFEIIVMILSLGDLPIEEVDGSEILSQASDWLLVQTILLMIYGVVQFTHILYMIRKNQIV